MISGTLMNAHGMLRSMFHIQLIAVAVKLVLLIVLVLHFGLLGAASAVGLTVTLEQALYSVVTLRHLGLGAIAVLAVTWRALVAVGVMAVGLAALGLGWTAATPGGAVLDLALAVPADAMLYGAAIWLCWLAAGRPVGAERDMFGMVAQAGRRASQVVARQLRLRSVATPR